MSIRFLQVNLQISPVEGRVQYFFIYQQQGTENQ